MTQKVKVLNAQAWQTDSIPGRHVQVEGENLTPQKSPLSSHLPYSKSKQKNTCYMYIHVYIHIHTCEYTYTYLWFLLPLSQIFLGRTGLSIFSLPFLRFCFQSVFPPKYFLFNSFRYRIDIFSTVSADGIKKKPDKKFFCKNRVYLYQYLSAANLEWKGRTLCSRLHPELSTMACRVLCASVGS